MKLFGTIYKLYTGASNQNKDDGDDLIGGLNGFVNFKTGQIEHKNVLYAESVCSIYIIFVSSSSLEGPIVIALLLLLDMLYVCGLSYALIRVLVPLLLELLVVRF